MFLILFYVAVFLRNTKIQVFPDLSERYVYLILFYVAVFPGSFKFSLVCLRVVITINYYLQF